METQRAIDNTKRYQGTNNDTLFNIATLDNKTASFVEIQGPGKCFNSLFS